MDANIESNNTNYTKSQQNTRKSAHSLSGQNTYRYKIRNSINKKLTNNPQNRLQFQTAPKQIKKIELN